MDNHISLVAALNGKEESGKLQTLRFYLKTTPPRAGAGRHAVVFAASMVPGGDEGYAIKFLRKEDSKEYNTLLRMRFFDEISALHNAPPNNCLIKYHGFGLLRTDDPECMNPARMIGAPVDAKAFDNERHQAFEHLDDVFYVMEKADCSLEDFLYLPPPQEPWRALYKKRKDPGYRYFDLAFCFELFSKAVDTVAAFHALSTRSVGLGYSHRDIKPGNFLVFLSQNTMQLKLADLGGLSSHGVADKHAIVGTVAVSRSSLMMQPGSRGFRAPEQKNGHVPVLCRVSASCSNPPGAAIAPELNSSGKRRSLRNSPTSDAENLRGVREQLGGRASSVGLLVNETDVENTECASEDRSHLESNAGAIRSCQVGNVRWVVRLELVERESRVKVIPQDNILLSEAILGEKLFKVLSVEVVDGVTTALCEVEALAGKPLSKLEVYGTVHLAQGPAVDTFALGCLLYHLCTGGKDAEEFVYSVLSLALQQPSPQLSCGEIATILYAGTNAELMKEVEELKRQFGNEAGWFFFADEECDFVERVCEVRRAAGRCDGLPARAAAVVAGSTAPKPQPGEEQKSSGAVEKMKNFFGMGGNEAPPSNTPELRYIAAQGSGTSVLESSPTEVIRDSVEAKEVESENFANGHRLEQMFQAVAVDKYIQEEYLQDRAGKAVCFGGLAVVLRCVLRGFKGSLCDNATSFGNLGELAPKISRLRESMMRLRDADAEPKGSPTQYFLQRRRV